MSKEPPGPVGFVATPADHRLRRGQPEPQGSNRVGSSVAVSCGLSEFLAGFLPNWAGSSRLTPNFLLPFRILFATAQIQQLATINLRRRLTPPPGARSTK